MTPEEQAEGVAEELHKKFTYLCRKDYELLKEALTEAYKDRDEFESDAKHMLTQVVAMKRERDEARKEVKRLKREFGFKADGAELHNAKIEITSLKKKVESLEWDNNPNYRLLSEERLRQIERLEKKVEELTEKLSFHEGDADWKSYAEVCGDLSEERQENQQLQSQNARLREALERIKDMEFYPHGISKHRAEIIAEQALSDTEKEG